MATGSSLYLMAPNGTNVQSRPDRALTRKSRQAARHRLRVNGRAHTLGSRPGGRNRGITEDAVTMRPVVNVCAVPLRDRSSLALTPLTFRRGKGGPHPLRRDRHVDVPDAQV